MAGNTYAAAQLYREFLTNTESFDSVTLEAMVEAIEVETKAAWIREVRQRYLGWEKLERLVARSS